MHRIDKALEIGDELNLSNQKISELIGVSANSFSMWTRGKSKLREKSLQKVQKFIDKYESGTLDLPKPKQLPKSDIKNIENLEKRLMYELIYKLENEYGGHLRNVPDDDPILPILKMMGDGVL